MRSGTVRRLRLWSDLVPSESGSGTSFVVSEFAVLSDGRELPILEGRGWTVFAGTLTADEYLSRLTIRDIERDIHNAVLSDDAETTGEWQDWQHLADKLGELGVDASADQLKQLPYAIELSDRLRSRLRDET